MSFQSWLASRYEGVKQANPGAAGRRALTLLAADEFWRTAAQSQPVPDALPRAPLNDPDPLDFQDPPSGIVTRRGLIIRTDFSNEEKWSEFIAAVLKAEKDGMADIIGAQSSEDDGEEESSDDDEDDEEGDGADADTPMEEDATASNAPPSDTFILIDPTAHASPHHAPLLSTLQNSSNLTLLRLFTDVDIVPTLSPPAGTKRVKGGSRLVDSHGLHEIYEGRILWVYDAKSNTDGCARLVSNRPASYGTATGDSWRARASFIWELQINMSANTMQISFGGEDRYDGFERQRNFDQAKATATI